MKTEAKLWFLEGEQGFKEIWSSDRKKTIFELDLDITKTNILVKKQNCGL